MKFVQPDDDKIDDLAFRLSMLTVRHGHDLVRANADEFKAALFFNRRSCQPAHLARRFVYAAATRRLRNHRELVASQRTMLALAADDSAVAEEVLDAFLKLSSLAHQFELGPDASDKQRRGLLACNVFKTRAHYAKLVRGGEIADSPTGFSLHRAKSRRRTGYVMFAMMVAWTWFLFIKMALDGAVEVGQLAEYMTGSVILSWWLTRSVFAAVRDDERNVKEVNSGLGPRRVVDRQRRKKI